MCNAFRLLALTGCRLNEVLGLRWDDVDFEAGTLWLADAKAGGRSHSVGALALALLDGIPRIEGKPRVFHGAAAGTALADYTLQKAWRVIRVDAGLEDVRIHDLRHTVGTYAGQTGANAFLVRDKLGHHTVAMTARYVNKSAAHLRVLSDQVESRIAAALRGEDPAEVVELHPASPGRGAS